MDSDFALLEKAKLGMGTNGEKKGEGSGILEAPVLGRRRVLYFLRL